VTASGDALLLLLLFFVSAYLFLTFSRISQAIDVLPVSWAFCENCLSARVFQRGRVFSQHDAGDTSMGTPVPFTGAPGVATAFFGYFF
jgi:hypothetical protein